MKKKLISFLKRHKYLCFFALHIVSTGLCYGSAVLLSGYSIHDVGSLMVALESDPLFSTIALVSFGSLMYYWSVFLLFRYFWSLFFPKKPKPCPAIDCMNFNCQHFDKDFLACEFTEVPGSE